MAAGIYMTWWFPASPVWLWSVGFAFIVLYVNSRSVGHFGTVEYAFSFIKVTAIVLFIIIGTAQILGLGQASGVRPVGLRNLYQLPGGFFPHGLGGMWMAVILGVLSFVGIEVIAVTSGEASDPKVTIPAALRATAIRIFLFYVLSLGIVAALIPWTQTGGGVTVTQSPFVKVLSHTGVPQAAGVMNFVIVSAALSGMNTNVYLCSRMLFSLSRGGYAPRLLGRLSASGAPVAATAVSGACILLAAAAAKLTPKAYSYLQGVALFGAIIVWMLILVSHIAFRRAHRDETLPVRMPGFPVMQIAGLVLLGALLATMGLDRDWNLSWIVGVPWLGRADSDLLPVEEPWREALMTDTLHLPTASEVEAARTNILGYARRTPLWRLDGETPPGVRIHLKLENLQPLGSFKIRAATNAIKTAGAGAVRGGVLSASAGNFGLGLALAARQMGAPLTIVVPDGSAANKGAALEGLGARVIRVPFDDWWQVLLTRRFDGAEGMFFHPVAESGGRGRQRHHRARRSVRIWPISTPSSCPSAAAD